jgi:hypothetical protein
MCMIFETIRACVVVWLAEGSNDACCAEHPATKAIKNAKKERLYMIRAAEDISIAPRG